MTELLRFFLNQQKKRHLLTCLQYVIGTFAVLISLSFSNSADFMTRIINSIIDPTVVQISMTDSNEMHKEGFFPIMHTLDDQIGSTVENTGALVFEKETCSMEANPDNVSVIVLNKNWKNYSQYAELFTGSFFSENGAPCLPAFIGYGYHDLFPDDKDTTLTFYKEAAPQSFIIRPIRYLDSDDYFFSGGAIPVTESIDVAQKFILVPETDTYAFDNSSYMRNLLMPEGTSKNDTVELIRYYATINGLSLSKRSVESAMKDLSDRAKPFIIITLVFSGLLLFLSSIGCMGVMLVNISFRKKDFSLLMSMGLRKKTLSLLLLMEGLMVSVVGYMVGVLLFELFTLIWVDNPLFKPSPSAFLITFLITSAAGLIGEAIPIKTVSALDPIRIIKEKN